ncbi:unnamed protein product [Prunus armeniaca]
MKTIYNARIRNRTKEFAGRTQMQQLLTKLSEHNYIEWHRTSGDIVTDLFWTHPINIDILRAFPHVLIMDCTYKTNRYRFPLLQIVEVTYTNMTFSVAYVYMNAEKEDNYTWALTALRNLLDDNCLPGVIVTDRELALLNSITSIFPKARHLLCRWHINKGVLANCKKLFGTLKQWKQFNEDWNTLVHLSPDHPIPPVSRMWHEQSDICNVTYLYSRYQARVDAFQQLPGVENVDGDGCDGSVSEMVQVCWRRWQRASSMVSKDLRWQGMSSSMFCDAGNGKGLLRWFCDGGWCKWDGVCNGVCLQEERIFGGVWLDIRWGGV